MLCGNKTNIYYIYIIYITKPSKCTWKHVLQFLTKRFYLPCGKGGKISIRHWVILYVNAVSPLTCFVREKLGIYLNCPMFKLTLFRYILLSRSICIQHFINILPCQRISIYRSCRTRLTHFLSVSFYRPHKAYVFVSCQLLELKFSLFCWNKVTFGFFYATKKSRNVLVINHNTECGEENIFFLIHIWFNICSLNSEKNATFCGRCYHATCIHHCPSPKSTDQVFIQGTSYRLVKLFGQLQLNYNSSKYRISLLAVTKYTFQIRIACQDENNFY